MELDKVNVSVDFAAEQGPVKPMHAVNNGPVLPAMGGDQKCGNFDEYVRLGIPYMRTHDTAHSSNYGGEYAIDITAIFPDFSKDPLDEKSYYFKVTDYLLEYETKAAKIFYRLGQKIEHGIRKDGVMPPKDNHKWAVICEHIIRHYNEGWANGYHMGIEYWEIWNEANLDIRRWNTMPRTWAGTPEQYFDLYITTANHLKKCFPNLKIGGPAISHISFTRENPWLEAFFKAITADGKKTPLDFLSWHIYEEDPASVAKTQQVARERLDAYGYTETESICNEWNYVEGWADSFVRSLADVKAVRGAAFTACFMIDAQHAGVDMLMYYDARPCGLNGLFDSDTLKPLKTYYVFQQFNHLYRMGTAVGSESDCHFVHVLAAKGSGKKAAMVAVYDNDRNRLGADVTLKIDNADAKAVRLYATDADRSYTFIDEFPVEDGCIHFVAPNYSVFYAEFLD